MVEIVQDFEPFFGYSGTNIPDTGAFQYLRKLGVVDIGSNSVRMVIFDGAARSPAYFFNEMVFFIKKNTGAGAAPSLPRRGRSGPAPRDSAVTATQ